MRQVGWSAPCHGDWIRRWNTLVVTLVNAAVRAGGAGCLLFWTAGGAGSLSPAQGLRVKYWPFAVKSSFAFGIAKASTHVTLSLWWPGLEQNDAGEGPETGTLLWGASFQPESAAERRFPLP